MEHTKTHVLTCYVGNKPQDIRVVLFCDASFAGSIQDSNSTSGAYLCLVGSHTFVPITWICKKQGAVSHSSSEAELISLDAGVRLEGIPALSLWETIVDIFHPPKVSDTQKTTNVSTKGLTLPYDDRYSEEVNILLNVDYVPPSLPPSSGQGCLIILEDNDAVIKMCCKSRSPNMRHTPRAVSYTHLTLPTICSV